MCDHSGKHHLIERFDNGFPEKVWACIECGEVVGRFKYVNTCGCKYIPDMRHWVRPSGEIVSEYE